MLELVSRARSVYTEEGVLPLLLKSVRFVQYQSRQLEKRYSIKYFWLTSESHTEAYRRWMNYRIWRKDARRAVGGFDKGFGELQYEFLRDEGLTPEDTLLDVGCGSLRGGRYFIDYLQAGNYTGMDITKRVIEEGKSHVGDETLREKDPTFVVNEDLRFDEFETAFDYLLAHSVIIHLPEEKVRECFRNVHKVMHRDSAFYFTYFDRAEMGPIEDNPSAFSHSTETLASIASENGLSLSVVPPEECPHSNQRIGVVRLD